ncbi:MAG TPA: T9SS C-terminal target domain-containing protein, partial [Flavobacteriales bacterium]|nr:T9SS C-terminal target domain-containing protein [Flavobacteriales bacterium]
PDLGCSDDDFVGCDVQRGLGYVYNWDENDQSCQNGIPGYGTPPPAIGIDFFEGPFQDTDSILDNGQWVAHPFDNPGPAQGLDCDQYVAQKGIPYAGLGVGYGDGVEDNERFGMRAFIYFSRDGNNNVNDPDVAVHYYNYLRSIWKDGTPQTYGLTGYSSDPSAVRAYYMFPGDTDPIGWGTGCAPQAAWSETAQVNPDRRFVESAGPFTLEPGAYNNITVGVVWARGANRLESVNALKVADDKAQALFDNCFRVLNGPDAPDVTIQELDRELILYISNPAGGSNNYFDYSVRYPGMTTFQDENYIEFDPTIPETAPDRYYRFQGYKIYQVADATVGPDELDDVSRARLLAQCDIHDTVSQIVNWIQDAGINLAVPTEMVNGGDTGIVHSFKVTQDLFSNADPRLVNFKTYYYMAIAYGYNNWQDYSPASGQATASGQPFPYLAGRKAASGSIRAYSGIPHKPAPERGGTVATTSYGDEFKVTRLEGQGNGGLAVLLDKPTEDAIMAGSPWRVDELHYEISRGPVKVKVVDPLNVPNARFELWFKDTIAPFPSPTALSSYKAINDGYWMLVRLNADGSTDTIHSNSTLGLPYEQLILDWGISIQIEQTDYTGPGLLTVYTKPLLGEYRLSGSSSGPADAWYSGIPDVDGENPLNWIRSGESHDQTSYPDLTGADDQQEYEKILGGTWTAGPLIGDTSYQPGAATRTDAIRGQGLEFAKISESPSVMVVFTPDKNRWTRCPVLEEHDKVAETTPAGTKKLFPRPVPSVDKMGRKAGDPGYNGGEGDLTSTTGMGWFPGYAIDLETGERLNMAFGENSSLFGGTIGKDMIWNPSDRLFSDLGEPIFGGSHWIYVFKNMRRMSTSDQAMPMYDEGAFLKANLDVGGLSQIRNVYR